MTNPSNETLQLTANNHFKFGYDGDFSSIARTRSTQQFQARYGAIHTQNLSWPESNYLAARNIYARFGQNTVVCYSGGCDSQICLESFLDQNLDVQVAILKFSGGLNDHDISWAGRFMENRGLKPLVFELDVIDFWNSSALFDFVDPTQCVSPQIACHLWLCDKVLKMGGVPVIGQGEPYLKKQIPKDYVPGVSEYLPSPWTYIESERLCSLYRYFRLRESPGVPGFFQYLPEQTEAFLRESRFLKLLVANEIPGKLSTRTSKFPMLQEFYPHLEVRPKYHGFEKIQQLSDRFRQQLAERFPDSDQDFEFPLSELMGQLYGN